MLHLLQLSMTAPGDTASTLGNIEVEIQKNTLTAQKADLLGHNRR